MAFNRRSDQVLRGRSLRRVAVAIVLTDGGPCSPAWVTHAIRSLGFEIGSAQPEGKAVADALGHEADRGWLRRVGRGRYVEGRISRASRYRILETLR